MQDMFLQQGEGNNKIDLTCHTWAGAWVVCCADPLSLHFHTSAFKIQMIQDFLDTPDFTGSVP